MSIQMWEIHIETPKTIGAIMEYFKSKGASVDYKMCKEGHGMMSIKHPQKASIYDFKVKLYSELGNIYRYEIGTWSKEEANLAEEWFKEV